jgi:hypothetical protein
MRPRGPIIDDLIPFSPFSSAILPVHYLPDYAATSFEFDTTRKASGSPSRPVPTRSMGLSSPLTHCLSGPRLYWQAATWARDYPRKCWSICTARGAQRWPWD